MIDFKKGMTFKNVSLGNISLSCFGEIKNLKPGEILNVADMDKVVPKRFTDLHKAVGLGLVSQISETKEPEEKPKSKKSAKDDSTKSSEPPKSMGDSHKAGD